MFQKILVPVDLSAKSVSAVNMAFELANRFSDAEVTFLHVIETIEHMTFDELKPFYKRLEDSAIQKMAEFSERFDAVSIPVEHVVLYGHRTKEIVDFAIRNRADLIVLASHRIDPDHPGHDWSSISYTTTILSPCPVLLVK